MYFQQIEAILQKNFPFEWKALEFKPSLQFGDNIESKWFNSLGVSLFPSKEVLLYAKKHNFYLLFTYYPLFHFPLEKISGFSTSELKLMVFSGISLYTIGDLIFFCRGGILDLITKSASLERIKNIYYPNHEYSIPIGRLCKPLMSSSNLNSILQNLKKNFGPKNIHLWGGNTDFNVNSIGIFEKKTLLKLDFDVFREEKIDLIIISDIELDWIWRFVNSGIIVITVDLLSSLTQGLKIFAKELSVLLPRLNVEYIPNSIQSIVIE